MTSITSDRNAVVRRCYAAAVAAVQPEPAMRRALRGVTPDGGPAWIFAVGKAAPGMARALVAWLAESGRAPGGGIVVGASEFQSPHSALQQFVGDHPIPGGASARAATAIGAELARVPANAVVHVAISGGASALMAGPLAPLSPADVTRTFELLLASGLDIHQMNAVRKRITQWSAGRLAQHLFPRQVRLWAISDVADDDLGSIGSGPCTGDAWTGGQIRLMLAEREAFAALPGAVRDAMAQETLKPGDAVFASVQPRIIANNAVALAAAADEARALGIEAQLASTPMRGEAAEMGREIAATTLEPPASPRITIWGGETTVTITLAGGIGGRSQELALAAAGRLRGTATTLLAAGTDGRDGPTDAAGAIVDGTSWNRIIGAGRDPALDLQQHDSYAALNAAGALFKTGPSGTNVMDIAIAASGWG